MRGVSNQRGLTLIELVVILAILSVLAAALIPAVLNYLEEGNIQSAVQDLKEMKAAFIALRVARGAFPPDDSAAPLAGAGDPDINGSDDHGIRFQGTADTKPWRGPYIDKEVKLHPWGDHYLYERGIDVLDIKGAGINDVAIVLEGTNIPASSKKRIDEILDDGCANEGIVQVEGASSCTDFTGGAVAGWGSGGPPGPAVGGELIFVIAEDDITS